MKNITGKLIGFGLGVAGFLLLFKIIFLVRIPPEDELAPGMVVIMAIFSGLFFAFLGNMVENYLRKKKA